MPEYSPAVTLAWQIGAMETAQAGFESIEGAQILIGLLKVGDILNLEVRTHAGLELTDGELEALEREMSPIEEALTAFHLDRTELRRLMRRLAGKGAHVHSDRVVHRSDACRMLFSRAKEIAAERRSEAVKPVHLFEAILEALGGVVNKAFAHLKVDIQALRSALSTAKEKKPVTVLGKKESENQEGKSATPFLDKYGLDLTRLAGEGKVEPLIGRREELLKVIRTLSRNMKNNPLLIGDAGVGKTAVVRGLALRIAQGNIAPVLQGKRIVEIPVAGLVAGTKYRGQFEERIMGILKEAGEADNVILFMDEIHTVVGAGSAEGSLDAANIMKPALSKGEISCIGATTMNEYRKHIEKDPALERRFQAITVEEPSQEETIEILEGLKDRLERHHGVAIEPSAIAAAVRLSVRYLPDRRLPDKALDIMDEACANVTIEGVSYYGRVEDVQKQGRVTEVIVARVISEWTGRPLEKVGAEEKNRLSHMEDTLKMRVIGQDEAVTRIAQVIRMARAGIRDPRRPAGVFLFLGPTGVGKTELARALAEFLFGSDADAIRLDMSEYMEKHSVARLVGAPPGYVGHDEEGQLTGRLRTRPYSVVLLDEIEKAHPEVLDIFLQVFDEGRLTDAKGRTVDGKSAVFIMTSNLGSQAAGRRAIGFGAGSEDQRQEPAGLDAVKHTFRPEFLNRIDEIVVFNELGERDILNIVRKMTSELSQRLRDQEIELEMTSEAMDLICREGYDPVYGARPLARAIERLVAKPLADRMVKGDIRPGQKITVRVSRNRMEFVTA
jgi:ATP-dependent Clp protease ATP-binding subunit ClpC